MSSIKGFEYYKKYWEDQASFMDRLPWDKEKVLKITIFNQFEINLKDLTFSNHSITKENGKTTLRLQVPYNYYELDDFKLKAIDLLGIKRNWLIDISLDNSRCTTLLSKKR